MSLEPSTSDQQNARSAAGLRALLLHLSVTEGSISPRLLARAACVCRAWAEEVSLPDARSRLRFEEPVSAVVLFQILDRWAAVVEEVSVPWIEE